MLQREKTAAQQSNFEVELEQFCLALSAVKACIWNISPDKKLHVSVKFVIPQQKCYGPQNVYTLENSMSLIFVAALAYSNMCVLSFRAYNRGGVPKKCFLEVPHFEQQIGIYEYFSWKVHELSEFLSCQAPS